MNTTQKKLTINAFSAIVQVVFTAFLYFFLYRYLIDTLGVKLLGVWSLIISFSSIANLANMGLTSGLVKFVAEYIAEKQEFKIGEMILTTIISLAVLFSLISIAILFGAGYFLDLFIDKAYLNIAISILPWSLASLTINACAGVFTSVLEGYQKNYLRNYIYIASGIVLFGLAIYLVPIYGLKGVAIAQTIQSLFIFVLALITIFYIHPSNRFNHWKWSKRSFKELYDYGYKFQAVSICQLLYEPTTKMLLSKFGGLTILGHYEMANRLVNLFRSLLVNANQVVIPVVAESSKTKTLEDRQLFYSNMSRIMLLVTLPLSTLLIILAPFISYIWIGNVEPDFNYAVYILTAGYIVNIMSGPAFFSCMGEGHLNIPLLSHISIAIINLAAGYLLGLIWQWHGIILAWGLSLAFGSLVTTILYQRRIHFGFKKTYTKKDLQILVVSIVLMLGGILFMTFNNPLFGLFLKTAILSISFLTVYFITLRKHHYILSLKDFVVLRLTSNRNNK